MTYTCARHRTIFEMKPAQVPAASAMSLCECVGLLTTSFFLQRKAFNELIGHAMKPVQRKKAELRAVDVIDGKCYVKKNA